MRDPDVERRLDFFTEELQVIELLRQLTDNVSDSPLVISNVTVVSMAEEDRKEPQNLLIEEGIITDSGDFSAPEKALVIDGSDRYVMPGLADMHVHTGRSARQDLLNLACGVTAVREMCGFPSMLSVREAVDQRRRLAPRCHVAGHIIASKPLEGYATVVGSADEAVEVVNDQIAAGYEFVKVHNLVEPDVYQAICKAAAENDVWVVGHVPHHIPIATAIEAGQRTFEHLKGYYHDWNLEMTDEPYVELTAAADVWNCPTLVTYRSGMRDHKAEAWLTGPEARHMALSTRVAWADLAAEGGGQVEAVIFQRSQVIFRALVEGGCRLIPGTDSGGGLPYLVPGFALLEELRLMQDLGMSPDAVLRSATVEASAALRRSDESGTVEIGKTADLILLESDPRSTVANLADMAGVCAAGRWLERSALDQAMDELRRLGTPRLEPPLAAEEILDRFGDLADSGYPLFELHHEWLTGVATG